MRSLWLDRGTGPDPVKCKQYGITCVYEDIRDATKASVAANAKLVGASGVYACWNWPGVPNTGRAFSDWVNEQLKKCDLGSPDAPRVHLNSENDNKAYVVSMLKRWRAHRDKRTTGWTMQAHKADVYAGSVPLLCSTLNISVLPQCYAGPLNDRVESSSEVLAWAMQGVELELLQPMLWAQYLGGWWDEPNGACAFIQGKLP